MNSSIDFGYIIAVEKKEWLKMKNTQRIRKFEKKLMDFM